MLDMLFIHTNKLMYAGLGPVYEPRALLTNSAATLLYLVHTALKFWALFGRVRDGVTLASLGFQSSGPY